MTPIERGRLSCLNEIHHKNVQSHVLLNRSNKIFPQCLFFFFLRNSGGYDSPLILLSIREGSARTPPRFV